MPSLPWLCGSNCSSPAAVVFGVLCYAVLSPSSNVECDLGCFVVFSFLSAKKQKE